MVEAEAKSGRAEVELGLVVGADQPQLALDNLKTGFFAETLKLFGCHLGALYAQQFIDFGLVFLEYLQVASVKAGRQQVCERHFGAEPTPADLLVAAERHLPGRESEEHDSVGIQEFLYACEESRFVLRLDVFDHVVDQHDVETVIPRRHAQKVSADELTGHIPFGEIFLGVFYLVGSQVYACHGAARLGERQQVSALAAADLQHPCPVPDTLESPKIVNVKFPGSLGQLPEIPFSVRVSLLHGVNVMIPESRAIPKCLLCGSFPMHNINEK